MRVRGEAVTPGGTGRRRLDWFSWKDVTFQDGNKTVNGRDLLSRTVLYGSHNATLAGKTTDTYANDLTVKDDG